MYETFRNKGNILHPAWHVEDEKSPNVWIIIDDDRTLKKIDLSQRSRHRARRKKGATYPPLKTLSRGEMSKALPEA